MPFPKPCEGVFSKRSGEDEKLVGVIIGGAADIFVLNAVALGPAGVEVLGILLP